MKKKNNLFLRLFCIPENWYTYKLMLFYIRK
jgi:hypothetical protein